MKQTRLLPLLLLSLWAFPETAEAQSFGAAPVDVAVTLVAGTGSSAGTANALWVRVHSENSNSWSGWKFHSGGLDREEAVTLSFEVAAGFGDIDQVAVYVGPDDGARISATVAYQNSSYELTPDSRWIKGKTKTFDRIDFSALVCCTTLGTDDSGSPILTGCGTYQDDTCPADTFTAHGSCDGCP